MIKKLSKRQFNILEFIGTKETVGNQDIKNYLEEKSKEKISRITVVRDINDLLKKGLIKKIGRGRNICYQEAIKNKILKYIDINEYFKKGPDERMVAFGRFNFNIFRELKEIFSKQEIEELNKLNKNYQKRIKKLPSTILKKEFERLTIELSWKSSQIEGNTYSLIDTEILIKENKEARGHKKEEAIMILNHKKALDYIFANQNDFKKINLRKLENVHDILIKDLNTSKGIRKRIVGIVGTKYRPLDNEFQIKEAIEKTLKLANSFKNPFLKAIVLILLISYIQPFEDGNKRTSRLIGNAVFLANNICPLSYRSINEADYKKAIILFYEQNNARFFKELFIEQFKFAVENYFL